MKVRCKECGRDVSIVHNRFAKHNGMEEIGWRKVVSHTQCAGSGADYLAYAVEEAVRQHDSAKRRHSAAKARLEAVQQEMEAAEKELHSTAQALDAARERKAGAK